jgi:hypothetical protein
MKKQNPKQKESVFKDIVHRHLEDQKHIIRKLDMMSKCNYIVFFYIFMCLEHTQ